jgi:hypothetical protein
MDIYEWEKLIRMELNFLQKLQFFISYKYSQNETIFLDKIIAPFREPFWLSEKHWFTVCDQSIHQSDINTILLYTIPLIESVDQPSFGIKDVICGISSKDNTYYINNLSRGEIQRDTAHEVSFIHLDSIYYNFAKYDAGGSIKLKYSKTPLF